MWQFAVKLTVFLANFDFRARKTTGAVRSGKFPLWRPYGDNALSRNEIDQMASYRSFSVTEPLWWDHDKPGAGMKPDGNYPQGATLVFPD